MISSTLSPNSFRSKRLALGMAVVSVMAILPALPAAVTVILARGRLGAAGGSVGTR
jgi:hypothetical protein